MQTPTRLSHRREARAGRSICPLIPSLFGPGLLWIGLLWTLSGCGYHPALRAQASADSILIPVFQNQTFEPALEGKLTRRVKQEFLSRGGFRITQDPGQARYILEGKVTGFGLSPISFNQLFQVAEYRVRISAKMKVLSAADRKPLWSSASIQGSSEYVVDPDPGISRSAQDLAINEALEHIAEEIWIEIIQRTAQRNPSEDP